MMKNWKTQIFYCSKSINRAVFLLILFSYVNSFAQNKPYAVSTIVYSGNGVGKFKGVTENKTIGVLINYNRSLKNNKSDWVKVLNAKNLNIGFLFTDMNGIEYPLNSTPYSFGKSFGVISQIDIGIINTKKLNLYFTPAFGITYIDKTTRTNPDSFIFGSHLNAIFNTALKGELLVGNGFSVISEVNFLHFSNGSFKIPNAGTNIVNIGLGIKKGFGVENTKNDSLSIVNSEDIKKNTIQFSAGIGRRGKYKMDDSFYRLDFYGGYSKFLNNVIALKSGVDFVYYEETYNPAVYDDSIKYLGENYEHFRAGISLGSEVKMNKISVNANYGYYLYFKSVYNQKTYWNIGIKYYLQKEFGLQASMNAHRFQADFINGGVFIML